MRRTRLSGGDKNTERVANRLGCDIGEAASVLKNADARKWQNANTSRWDSMRLGSPKSRDIHRGTATNMRTMRYTIHDTIATERTEP
jgi:hypothetical protein